MLLRNQLQCPPCWTMCFIKIITWNAWNHGSSEQFIILAIIFIDYKNLAGNILLENQHLVKQLCGAKWQEKNAVLKILQIHNHWFKKKGHFADPFSVISCFLCFPLALALSQCLGICYLIGNWQYMWKNNGSFFFWIICGTKVIFPLPWSKIAMCTLHELSHCALLGSLFLGLTCTRLWHLFHKSS